MRLTVGILISLMAGAAYANTDLSTAIENVHTTCGGISAELSDMKKMAGINTAVTGVGTVAGGVAVGTGIAKAGVDKEIEEWERILQELAVEQEKAQIAFTVINIENVEKSLAENPVAKLDLDERLNKLNEKSKTLGNVRTGTLATATVANIAGAAISGTNKVKGDLKQQIDECLASVKTLSNVRMQARISQTATDAELARAEEIIRACDAWSTVDITPINNRSTGATVSAGIGAATGLAGTVTSIMANSDGVHSDNSEAGKAKEKNLNTAANVLAGGTTVASATATIFNATQISAIKRAATVADECEGALK